MVGSDVTADGASKLYEAVVGGIAGAPTFEGENGGLADVPRGDKPRLADAEGDDVVHGLDDVKEIANTRARDVAYMVGDETAMLLLLLRHKSDIW